MPRGHPLVPLFRNSGITQVVATGLLVSFSNHDVEPAMLEIAKWCSGDET